MTTYALTSDAASVYRESTGVLVARESGSAMSPGFLGFDHTCTDAHHDDQLAPAPGVVVVSQTLQPALPR